MLVVVVVHCSSVRNGLQGRRWRTAAAVVGTASWRLLGEWWLAAWLRREHRPIFADAKIGTLPELMAGFYGLQPARTTDHLGGNRPFRVSRTGYNCAKDFSFLRTALVFGAFAAMGFIVDGGALIGFNLGHGLRLRDDRPVVRVHSVRHVKRDACYRIGQHVAAALALFASVALLFWYILQLFLSRRD